VVRRPRLCGNHALDLIGRLECPQADDCDEELPVRSSSDWPDEISWLTPLPRSGVVEPIAPRSANGAQGIGLGQ